MNLHDISYDLLLYHGTSDAHSENIQKNGFLMQKVKRKNDWLGPGIYFFREDHEQARIWAQSAFRKHETVETIEVIQVRVKVDDPNFLNLDSRSGIAFLDKHVKQAKLGFEKLGIVLEGPPDKLRHLIMSQIPEIYKVIQYTFTMCSKYDSNLLLQSADVRLHGTQVCIRDENLIPKEISVIIKQEVTRKSS